MCKVKLFDVRCLIIRIPKLRIPLQRKPWKSFKNTDFQVFLCKGRNRSFAKKEFFLCKSGDYKFRPWNRYMTCAVCCWLIILTFSNIWHRVAVAYNTARDFKIILEWDVCRAAHCPHFRQVALISVKLLYKVPRKWFSFNCIALLLFQI